ncbi:membrane protein [Klebsiella phage Menlow]|uniref:Uncharacterized protein n=1 Tax=Klebsiella phage Menlow TaxID=2054273 RepID=A0A2H5BND6_9CAUD|nr:membrane protein [Klebsiella phage Menlow]AUG87812.1 hypothetical protein CPT_Menlow_111 [Klebsiella phage Menlow]UJD04789.1 hypothetical protein PWKp5_00046 [Klebsiella phage PWKp5]
MNIDWNLVYLVLAVLASIVFVVWIILGLWFYRLFRNEKHRIEERMKRQEQIRNRRENW